MSFALGQAVLVQHAPDQPWKECVIVRHIKNLECWALTPTFVLFRLNLRVPPLHQMQLLSLSRELPAGVSVDNCELVKVDTATRSFTDTHLEWFEQEAIALSSAEPCPPGDLATVLCGELPVSGCVWVVGMPPPNSELVVGTILAEPPDSEPDSDPSYIEVEGEDEKVWCYYVLVGKREDFIEGILRAISHIRTPFFYGQKA